MIGKPTIAFKTPKFSFNMKGPRSTYFCFGAGRQLSRRFFIVAGDTFWYTLLRECDQTTSGCGQSDLSASPSPPGCVHTFTQSGPPAITSPKTRSKARCEQAVCVCVVCLKYTSKGENCVNSGNTHTHTHTHTHWLSGINETEHTKTSFIPDIVSSTWQWMGFLVHANPPQCVSRR